jgi:hypothetical protein
MPVNSSSADVSNLITWVGGASVDWFTPANWDQNRVPTRDDFVSIPYGLIEVNTNAQFAQLDLQHGTLWGELHVETIMNLYGSDVSGSLSIGPNGLINIRGHSMFSGTASNAGNVVIWPEATHRWYSTDATWYNLPGGVLELRGSRGINSDGQPARATLINFGTVRKIESSVFPLGVFVVNNGLLRVEAGTLALSGGMISSGTLEISADAAVVLRGGAYDFRQEHRVTGPGAFVIAGDIGFEGDVHDRLEWTNGIISGSLTIASNGVLDVTHHWYKILARGTTVTNHGSVNLDMDGFYWYWDGDVVWHNSPSGTLTTLNSGEIAGSGIVVNEGTMRSAGATIWVRLQHLLLNHGLVEVNAGGWELVGGLLSDGQFYVGPNTFFTLREGTATFRETHTVTGPGLFGIYEYANLHIQDWIYSRFDWRGGTIHGNIRVHSNAVLNLVGGQFSRPPTLGPSSRLTNDGTIFLFPNTDGEWYWGDNATLHNGGLFEARTFGTIGFGRDTQFRNTGMLRTVGQSLKLATTFTNVGTLDIRSGSLELLQFWARGLVQTAGETILNGGYILGDVQLLGGVLRGSGQIQGSLTNAGTIEIRSDTGPITVRHENYYWQSHYVQLPAGSLSLHLSSGFELTGPLLDVKNTANLAGHLGISLQNGTEPSLGTLIALVNSQNPIGRFQSYSGLGIRTGSRFDILYRASDVALKVTPSQQRLLFSSPEHPFPLRFDGDPETVYELQASLDLTNWQSLLSTSSQTGIIDFTDPDSANFQNRFYRVRQVTP